MILAIDYDMTIVDVAGKPIEGAKENINQLHDDGHEIIIWTSREGASLEEAIKTLQSFNIDYDLINENSKKVGRNPRKIIADCYIDDKGILGIPDWNEIYSKISKTKNFQSMETIKHTFGQVRAIPQNVEETRTIEFVISNNTKDRHGTVLPVDKWNLDRFNANGIVGYQHNVYGGDLCNAPDPDQVIGKGRAWIENDKLIGSVTFEPADMNPLAEKIFRKVLFGTLSATSVGFNPTASGYWGQSEESERGTNPTYYYDGQELLEFSIVNIPSNPDALKRSMRDQASNAIAYIYRQLGGNVRFSDIEKMTVGDVIAQLEKNPAERGISVNVEVEIDKPEENPVDQPEIPEPDPQPSTSDEDLVVATRAKLALMAQQ